PKLDDQRLIPVHFHGKMTRFWGIFGVPPLREQVVLSGIDQAEIRGLVADLVARQGGLRSYAYSESVRQSRAQVSAWLSMEDAQSLANHIAVAGDRTLRDSLSA